MLWILTQFPNSLSRWVFFDHLMIRLMDLHCHPEKTNSIRDVWTEEWIETITWQLSRAPSLYPAHKNTSCMISRLPAVLNHLKIEFSCIMMKKFFASQQISHLWHRSFGMTSTSTSWSTFGTVVAPCLILPHPATVAIFPTSFTLGGGKHTGKMCCLNLTLRFSFTNEMSFWKSLGE